MTPIRWTRVALVALVAMTALAFAAAIVAAPRRAEAAGVFVADDRHFAVFEAPSVAGPTEVTAWHLRVPQRG